MQFFDFWINFLFIKSISRFFFENSAGNEQRRFLSLPSSFIRNGSNERLEKVLCELPSSILMLYETVASFPTSIYPNKIKHHFFSVHYKSLDGLSVYRLCCQTTNLSSTISLLAFSTFLSRANQTLQYLKSLQIMTIVDLRTIQIQR